MSRCRWVGRGASRYFHPECMGGAVLGLDGCTCRNLSSINTDRITRLAVRVAMLEATIRRLTKPPMS